MGVKQVVLIGFVFLSACSPVSASLGIPKPTITDIVSGNGSFEVHWDFLDTYLEVTGWQIAYRVDGVDGHQESWRFFTVGVRDSSTGGDRRSATQPSLRNGVRYAVFVRAVVSQEYGPWSEGVWVTPGVNVPTPTPSVPRITEVPIITDIVSGDGSFEVHWDFPDTYLEVTGWQIAYRVDGVDGRQESWRFLTAGVRDSSTGGDRRSATQPSLRNGVRYAVFVRAVVSQEYGPWSGGLWVTPGVNVPTPTPSVPRITEAPTVTTLRVSTRSISIRWEYLRDLSVTHYEIQYRRRGASWRTTIRSKNVSGITIGGNFFGGERYEVRIRAINKAGGGPWSGHALVVPTPTPIPTPTPRPTPTAVPTPPSNAYDNGCLGKTKLKLPSTTPHSREGYPIKVADIKLAATFANPVGRQPSKWAAPVMPTRFGYGFMLRVETGSSYSGIIPGVVGILVLAKVDESGAATWSVTLRESAFVYRFLPLVADIHQTNDLKVDFRQNYGALLYVLSSGSFEYMGIPFNIGEGEWNHVAFVANGNAYEFMVNGHDVPLGIDRDALAAIEELVGPYRYHDTGEWRGLFNVTYYVEDGEPVPRTGGSYEKPVGGTGRIASISLPWAACVP